MLTIEFEVPVGKRSPFLISIELRSNHNCGILWGTCRIDEEVDNNLEPAFSTTTPILLRPIHLDPLFVEIW